MSSTSVPETFFDPERPLRHIGWKLAISLILLGLVVVYYIVRYSTGTAVLRVLKEITPPLLGGMMLLNLINIYAQGGLFQKVYKVTGYQRPRFFLSCLYLGMSLVNTVAPTLGLSGLAYMMYLEKKRGLSRTDTLLINYLHYITNYLVFLLVLLLGLAYLLVIGGVTGTVLIATLIFTLFVASITLIGYLAFTRPLLLIKATRTVSWMLGKITGHKTGYFRAEQIDSFVENFQRAWKRSSKSPVRLLEAGGYALVVHTSSIAMLWLAFLTFQMPSSLLILVAGYTIGTLLNIVPFTPSGIGLAEGGMTAVFVAFGVPVEQALAVTLLYRAVFVWFPLGLGLIAVHLLPGLAGKHQGFQGIIKS